jgi:multiple sugar transport system substrate-binding protein
MRRALKLILVTLLIVPALALIVFGPRGAEEVPDGRVVVQYWEKWTGNEEQQMRSIVDAFNDTVGREKNIYVRYMSITAINQKTLVAIAAGTPPDVAGLWDSNIVPYATENALEPLEDLAREHGIVGGTYKKAYWDACHYDGHLYALVSTPACVALLYNRLAFEQSAGELRAAGLDPHRPPRTLQELDRYADALTKKDASGRCPRPRGSMAAASSGSSSASCCRCRSRRWRSSHCSRSWPCGMISSARWSTCSGRSSSPSRWGCRASSRSSAARRGTT